MISLVPKGNNVDNFYSLLHHGALFYGLEDTPLFLRIGNSSLGVPSLPLKSFSQILNGTPRFFPRSGEASRWNLPPYRVAPFEAFTVRSSC